MKECSRCGTRLPETARYCMTCGRPASGGEVDAALRDELLVTLAARRELGPDMEPEIIEGFLARLEQVLNARTVAPPRRLPAASNAGSLALAVSSITFGVLFTVRGIFLNTASFVTQDEALVLCGVWAAIAAVNATYGVLRRWPSRA